MITADSLTRQHSERELRLAAIFTDAGIASSPALLALLATLYRDRPNELAHAQRVGIVAVRIAGELGLPARTVADIERAAWLHDLGKLVIPDGPGTESHLLRNVDLDVWTRQMVASLDIINASPLLRPAASLVMASRECMDGSGFPNHLEGDAIPIGARILHVADTFDALSELCAVFAVSADSVNVELVRHTGTRFDSAVVAAWLRLMDERSMQYIPRPGERAGTPV